MANKIQKYWTEMTIAVICVFYSGLIYAQQPPNPPMPAMEKPAVAPQQPQTNAPAAVPQDLKNQKAVQAKVKNVQSKEPVDTREAPGLKFNNAPFELLLNTYAEATGRTLLIDPKVPKGGAITLRSQGMLTMSEYLQAIEAVLAMNEIGLINVNDKFLKVVPIRDARREEMDVKTDEQVPSGEQLISQLVSLKYIDIKEAETVIKNFTHSYASVHLFERTNSILLTDTTANITRIIQILALVDQPIERLEEPHIIKIRYSKASDIKKKLETIIAESQEDAKKSTIPKLKDSGGPGTQPAVTPAIPGVIRAPRAETTQAGKQQTVSEIIEQAERGMIRGTVKIIDDDRTNLLIIITRKENMVFFEKIIQVLDVETQPDVTVKILRLEYAVAESVAETLNTLIGKVKENSPQAGAATPAAGTAEKGGDAKSAALNEYVNKLKEGAATTDKAGEKSKLGELSAANVKILPDKRTNSILIMASKSDLAAIEEIVKNMDMMLLQVMIEVVIVQVDLDDTMQSGMHWIQRALIVSDNKATAKGSVAGTAGSGKGDLITSLQDSSTLTSLGTWADSGGLTAYFTHFGLNLDGIVRMLESDSRTKILNSPRIVTTDNTKAKIESTEQQYFLKGSSVDQFGNVTPQTEIKDIGLLLEVTPHINKSRNVMMEISQSVSDVAGSQQIGNQGSWPTTKKRSMTASIAVRDGETIILGGLVKKTTAGQKSGIPILSGIPLLGRLFSYKSDTDRRAEVVVFITPYVLETPEEIETKSQKMRDAINVKGMWQSDWSDSKLAELSKTDAAKKRQEDKKRNAELKIKAEMEKAEQKAIEEAQSKKPAEVKISAPVPVMNAATQDVQSLPPQNQEVKTGSPDSNKP